MVKIIKLISYFSVDCNKLETGGRNSIWGMSIKFQPFADKFYPLKLEIGRNQLYRLYGATICDNQKLNQHYWS